VDKFHLQQILHAHWHAAAHHAHHLRHHIGDVTRYQLQNAGLADAAHVRQRGQVAQVGGCEQSGDGRYGQDTESRSDHIRQLQLVGEGGDAPLDLLLVSR